MSCVCFLLLFFMLSHMFCFHTQVKGPQLFYKNEHSFSLNFVIEWNKYKNKQTSFIYKTKQWINLPLFYSKQYTMHKTQLEKGNRKKPFNMDNLEQNKHNSLRENGHTRKIIINRNILLFVNNKSIHLYM